MNNEIQEQLEKIAYKRSIPYCYNDQIECPTGVCKACHSDDLMRLVSGVGCEYGVDWIVERILETELDSANLEESFEQSIRECYSETTKVGWMEFDTVNLIKEQDPISWRCALSEYESQEESEGNIITLDGGCTYYWSHDIETLISKDVE